MHLILVRHALPERAEHSTGNGGPADPPLTEHGVRQAERLVGALAGVDVTAIYTSPMARARQTAAPIAAATGLAPVVVPDLVEFDARAGRYIPVHEMAEREPDIWARMRAGLLPAYVDVEAFGATVSAALERIVAAHEGRETAVVVAHAGVVNIWLARLLEMPRPLAFPLDYVGITRVSAGRDGRRLVRSVNETAHVADLLALTG